MKLFALLASLLVLLGIAAPAHAKLRGLELGYEASPAMIDLPSSVGGGLILRRGTAVAPQTLPTNAATQYLVGDQAVTLDAMRKLLRDYPGATLTVMVSKTTGVVTRVKVQGNVPLPSSDR